MACDIIAGRREVPGGTIFRDDAWVVDHAVGSAPDAPIPLRGFLIIKPARHVEHVHELTPEEMRRFAILLHDVTNALQQAVSPEKVYIMSLGESVKHVHWYVIPRYGYMPANGIEVMKRMFAEHAWTCAWDEAAAVAIAVRSGLDRVSDP